MAAQSHDAQQSAGPDSRFADALRPLVDTALKRSLRDEPAFWAQTLSPVLGPAIRTAVASAIRNMVQMLNQLLENSLSARSWRWRVESWRTGKPFAEVVLLRTLIYRVEQVLLVEKQSGLLLASVSAPGVNPKDSDLVSAMLTAIQEFIHESFRLVQDDGIRQIHTGEFSLWVESGPLATLAAAVRGNAPVEFHQVLRAAVDLIHEEMGSEIRQFRGDATLFEQCARPILEGCLQSRFQERKAGSNWRVWVCAAVAAAGLALWGFLRLQQARRSSEVLESLRATPGIIITQSTREHGKDVLRGLRDPFADAAESVLAKNGVSPNAVSIHLQPFFSLDPRLLIRRARAAIGAPDSVSVSIDGDVLRLTGAASHDWILRARNTAPKLALAGVRELRTGQLQDRELEALRSEIQSTEILFETGSSTIAPAQTLLIGGVAPKLRQWIDGSIAIGRVPRVMVVGHADRTGTDLANSILSQQRARGVTELLLAAGIQPDWFTAARLNGGEDIAGSGTAESARRRNVVFRLSASPGDAEGEGR